MTLGIIKTLYMILLHKFFVLKYGIQYTKVSIFQLLIHDISKFGPSEFPYYVKRFTENSNIRNYPYAWRHHTIVNKHHWEYWCIPEDGYKVVPLEMPEKYTREMVADWLAASRTYEGKFPILGEWTWIFENARFINVHPNTEKLINELFFEIFGLETFFSNMKNKKS